MDWSRWLTRCSAVHCTTGGSWWWSPMSMTRFRRGTPPLPSPPVAACSSMGTSVSASVTCAASSITSVSYVKPSASSALRARLACVHVMATSRACLVSM